MTEVIPHPTITAETGSVYHCIGRIGNIPLYMRIWTVQWGNGYDGFPTVFAYRIRANPTDPENFREMLPNETGTQMWWDSIYDDHASKTFTLVLQEAQQTCNLVNSLEQCGAPAQLALQLQSLLPNYTMDMPMEKFSGLFYDLILATLPVTPESAKVPRMALSDPSKGVPQSPKALMH